MPGLLNFVDNEFSGVQKPITVIVTPKDRQNPVPGVLMYESMVEAISTGLLMIFPKGTPTDYTPKHDSHSQIWLAYVDQQLMTTDKSRLRRLGYQPQLELRSKSPREVVRNVPLQLLPQRPSTANGRHTSTTTIQRPSTTTMQRPTTKLKTSPARPLAGLSPAISMCKVVILQALGQELGDAAEYFAAGLLGAKMGPLWWGDTLTVESDLPLSLNVTVRFGDQTRKSINVKD
ncbi:hypothetical protein LTR06_011199 [Exophiala xenobiotica]|nr:hypothetical protein LTR06_011199 [Exophiala xenobiotica]